MLASGPKTVKLTNYHSTLGNGLTQLTQSIIHSSLYYLKANRTVLAILNLTYFQ